MTDEPTQSDQSIEKIGLITDLVQLLTTEPNVIMRQGPLASQGRLSFGRENSGAEGVGLFILAEGENEDEQTCD